MRSLLVFLVAIAPSVLGAEPSSTPNSLSESERAAGWRLLFDGHTTTGWRGYKKDTFPSTGWTVENGSLRAPGKPGGNDILTVDKFDDYELAWDWKINEGGNSGVKYFVLEDHANVIGHEYQLMGEPDIAAVRHDLKHATASFYDVLPVDPDIPLRTPGSWNQSRVIIRGNHVEHWLNGRQVVSYELGSDVVKAGIAASKFKKIERFGTRYPHHILLQDHGGDVSFRNLKLRPLKP